MGTGWAGGLGGVYLQGATLRETLLLNLAPIELPVAPTEDLPAWERSHPSPRTLREATGPIDVLTWQSRRVRLFHDADLRACGLILTNGTRLSLVNQQNVEHLSQWRRSPAQEKQLGLSRVIMPSRHDPSRAVWRGLPAVLGRQSADSAPPPGCVDGVERLVEKGVLSEDFPIHLVAVGLRYGPKDAVVSDAFFDSLDFAVGAIRDPDRVQMIIRCADAAERAAGRVAGFSRDLHESAGGHKDQAGAAAEAARARAFEALDPLFRQWLLQLDLGSDEVAESAWQRAVREAALRLARQMLQEVPARAWIGTGEPGEGGLRWRSAPAAEARLRAGLWKDLPMAQPETEQR
jgi:CRISPR system Cascade subunit CasA